jgi:hypothetical protein
MLLSLRSIGLLAFLLIPLVCASCVSMGLSKTAQLEPSSGPAASEVQTDKSLVDTWELECQVNDKGEEEPPKESTKTRIEFTRGGKVIFNRMDNENSDLVKSRTGKYNVDKTEIHITDDAGNTVKWPYQVTGDTLTLVMPEVKKKFRWRRLR